MRRTAAMILTVAALLACAACALASDDITGAYKATAEGMIGAISVERVDGDVYDVSVIVGREGAEREVSIEAVGRLDGVLKCADPNDPDGSEFVVAFEGERAIFTASAGLKDKLERAGLPSIDGEYLLEKSER